MVTFLLVAILTLNVVFVFVTANDIEEKVTARMKHIMSKFVSEGNNDHPMSDVLAFVHSNYNIPVDQVKTYYRMWHGIFPRMIIFGEWSHEAVHEMHQQGLPVYKCPENGGGSYAQLILLKGLEQYHHPAFKGYIYIHDDLLISPEKLVTLDKSKIWISNQMERKLCEPWESRGFDWVHFNTGHGISAIQSMYDTYPETKEIMANCSDLARGEKGDPHRLFFGHSDFLYVPTSLVPSYRKYMKMFVEKNVFLEIAIPNWAKCFTPNFDLEAEQLEICTTWDYSVRSSISKWGHNCKANTTIIHPVKYSNNEGLKFAQEWLLKRKNAHSGFEMSSFPPEDTTSTHAGRTRKLQRQRRQQRD